MQNESHLLESALGGDSRALNSLLAGVRDWVFNVVRRMLLNPQESEDAAQEILVKIAVNLSAYDASRAAFRTWCYRIAVNHAMSMKRGSMEQVIEGFDWYARGLDETPDRDLPADELSNPETQVLIEEAKASCTLGMLLCLDREQRMALILSDFMGLSDRKAAELLVISHDAFRKRLSRARRDLHEFMDNRCGLVNTSNPCRCSRKMRSFMEQGWISATDPKFSAPHLARLKEKAAALDCEHEDFRRPEYDEVFRSHPHYEMPEKLLAEILEKYTP